MTRCCRWAAWKRLFDEYLRERAARHGEPLRPFENEDYLRYVDGRPRFDGVAAFLESRGIDLAAGSSSDPPEAETVGGLGNRKNGYFLALVAEDGVRPFRSSLALVRAHCGRRGAPGGGLRQPQLRRRAAGGRDARPVRRGGRRPRRRPARPRGQAGPGPVHGGSGPVGVRPERAAVVEDALAGVEAGRRGGFGLVVGVDRGGLAEELKARGADVVVADLGELRLDDWPAGT